MITIEAERCTGCGACAEACPTDALPLVEAKAGWVARRWDACLWPGRHRSPAPPMKRAHLDF